MAARSAHRFLLVALAGACLLSAQRHYGDIVREQEKKAEQEKQRQQQQQQAKPQAQPQQPAAGAAPAAAPAKPAATPGAAPAAAAPPAAAPPAGTRPAGTPPAGTPPAGTPPAGTPPAGTPPAGTPPAGTPPAGAPATPQPSTAPQTAPAATPALTDTGGFVLDNVSLVELVDILARRMKINYILDPKVKGNVTVHTYGEVKSTDLMPLLETILRVNGAAIVKVGDLYRIVPVAGVPNLPIKPSVNGKDLPEDERMIMNMIFLKYVTVGDISKLLQPFLGEGAATATYEPANLLIILDNARSMKRTLELIAMFDSDTFATQRVRSFQTKHGRPSDLAKELDSVFKAFSLSEKSGAVKFVPVDRINTILAVAPNPGAFAEVEKWLAKLDVPVKAPVGAVDNYAYRLKYSRAEIIAMAIMALYSGNPMAIMQLSMMANTSIAGGAAYGVPGMGMGYGGYGSPYGGGGGGYPGYGGGSPYSGYSPYAGGMGGMNMMYGGGYPFSGYAPPFNTTGQTTATPPAAAAAAAPDQTGQYLGASAYGAAPGTRMPRVIPNPLNNTLLVQATPTEWEQIRSLIEQLDVPPRQVLIEAKIYSVDLTGAFQYGVDSYFQHIGGDTGIPASPTSSRTPVGAVASGTATLTAGLLVGHTRELLAVVQAAETHSKARVIQAPSIIATDSIPASLNVGEDVPTLTSQALAGGAQQSGNSLFTNTIGSRSTGVTLSITPYVNSSGVVTMMISQNVSAPQATTTSNIQSPTFATKSVQTQVTVQDSDTIAIAGIINESEALSSAGIPFLSRIPILGAAFGSKTYNKSRTELIVFITPRVIYDTNQLLDATEELKEKVKGLQGYFK